MAQSEPWLRGPVEGFEPLLMPIVHTLMQVREDLENLVASVPAEHVWQRLGGAASIGISRTAPGRGARPAVDLCAQGRRASKRNDRCWLHRQRRGNS